ncbi:MAG: alginate export family protein [Bryobacteraceae bacterium]
MRPILLILFYAGLMLAQQPAAKLVPSDGLNAQLPGWLRFSGEYRARLEAVGGGNYREGNDDAYLLNRIRLNLRIQPTPWMKFTFQGQDARVFAKTLKPYGPPFQDRVDLRMAFVELGDSEKGSFALRGGRQELAFGEQRLVGHLNWLNTARTFDAVRATFRHNGYRLDAFAASVVNLRDGEFNRRQDGNNFHGLYGGIEKLVPNAVIEPYAFWRVGPGRLNFKTYGVRFAGKLPGNLDYGTEMAVQEGGFGSDEIGAWAGHYRLGYTLAKLRYKPRLISEYNYATGDKSPSDRKRGTFDILYPTPHDKYGLANQVGWKNIHHLRFGPELKLSSKVTITSNYHSWWLASATDGVYSATGNLIARVVSGTAGRHVGQEFDGQVFYTATRQLGLAAGFAHIFPGQFLKAATSGASYNYPYVMLGYAF